MTQKYTNPEAHERMDQGLCPECGNSPEEHSEMQEFWIPRKFNCSLLPWGVTERIEHYKKFKESEA